MQPSAALLMHPAPLAGACPCLLGCSSSAAAPRIPLLLRPCRFVLLKERTRLHGEKLLYRDKGERMPDPSRIGRVRKSMARIKQVRLR